MRFAHEFMGADATVFRNSCQRLPVTEFRLNANMEKGPNIGFCKRVKDRREELKMTRQELADRSGLKYTTIADIENENSFSSRRIDALANALQTTPEYLRDGIKTTVEVVSERVLSAREKDLIFAYRSLTKPSRLTIDQLLKNLPKKRSGKIPRVYDPLADRGTSARSRRSG
jgi:transcriptional regulator with XRE-family HTH domain